MCYYIVFFSEKKKHFIELGGPCAVPRAFTRPRDYKCWGFVQFLLVNPQLNVSPRCIPTAAIVRSARVFPDVERISGVSHAAVPSTEFVVTVVVEVAASVAIKASVAIVLLVSVAVGTTVSDVCVGAPGRGADHIPLARFGRKRAAGWTVRIPVFVRKRHERILLLACVSQYVNLVVRKFAVRPTAGGRFARVPHPASPLLLATDSALFSRNKSGARVVAVELAVRLDFVASKLELVISIFGCAVLVCFENLQTTCSRIF